MLRKPVRVCKYLSSFSMLRNLTCRAQGAAVAISLRSAPTKSWRPLRQLERYKSTTQDFTNHDRDGLAAVIHGGTGATGIHPKDLKHAASKQQPSSAQAAKDPKGVQSKPKPSARSRARGRRSTSRPISAAQNLDVSRIRSSMYIPTKADYSDLPLKAFTTPRVHISKLATGSSGWSENFRKISSEVWSCTVGLQTELSPVKVNGDGKSKKAAETAAYLHLYAKLHELDQLRAVIQQASKEALNQDLTKREAIKEGKLAMIDIFNYCARYDALPLIKSQKTAHYLQRKKQKSHVETIIEFPVQSIRVVGIGKTLETAESDAAAKFKREVEAFQARLGIESMIIKDATALTTDNVAQFVEFLRIVRPGIDIAVTHQEDKFSGGTCQYWADVRINTELIGRPAKLIVKKNAESVALLAACVEVKKQDDTLWPRFLRALRQGNGQILRPITPIDMVVDEDCTLVMRETLLAARKAGLPDEVASTGPIAQDRDNQGSWFHDFGRMSQSARQEKSLALTERLRMFEADIALIELRRKKSELPMNQYRDKVLTMINDNLYSIVVGATGSGKTTQVPQILLDDAITKGNGASCNIVCTQPRRIAATSVAQRVAAERGEKLQQTVGHHVRFDARLPQSGGSINYCTTGILLQQLRRFPDEILGNVSHLIIDEVHERDVIIDFLLILLKKNILRRTTAGQSVPQVILMSATMDSELFSEYFKTKTGNALATVCPSISVPGRTFPVRERYLDEIITEMTVAQMPTSVMQGDADTRSYIEFEDKFAKEDRASRNESDGSSDLEEDRAVIDWRRERKINANGHTEVGDVAERQQFPLGLIASTIAHIARTSDDGAILVFLPGLQEIVRVEEQLRSRQLGIDLTDKERFQTFLLHSSIAATQQTIFDPVPKGCRKIILSTNIAETSVTIPDVQYVVDTGKLREKRYDAARRITSLECTWVSKSNAKQRAGRAGRVQNGNYYALYSKERYSSLRAVGLPELLRTDLQETCLAVKSQAFAEPIREFLADAIEPPAPEDVNASVIKLQQLDALTEAEDITPLGRLLAALPVHPSLGKMIVLGIIFKCLDPMLVLGAASTGRSLFVTPLDARAAANEKRLEFVQGSGSDHIAVLNAVRELRHHRDRFGHHALHQHGYANYMHIGAFKTIESTVNQIEEILAEAGLIPHTSPRDRLDGQSGSASMNTNSHKVPLIKALLLSGLHPNLAISPSGHRLFRTPGEKNVLVHPSSSNGSKDLWPISGKSKGKGKPSEGTLQPGLMYSFGGLSKSNDGNSLFMRDTTESTPLIASLFGGQLGQNNARPNILEVDGWLPFFIKSNDRRSAKTIIEFRKALERILTSTINELGDQTRNRRAGTTAVFLADDKVRETFAAGLVEVLDRDIRTRECINARGWPYRSNSSARSSL